MTPRFGPDPEQERRQGAADLLLMRVGLALIEDARHGGGFETDEARLEARVAELVAELGPPPWPGSAERPPVEASPVAPDLVDLSVRFDESSAVEARLRSDGVLLDQGTSMSVSAVAVDESELEPERLEQMQAEAARFHAERERPQLTGERFLRAVAAQPEPGAEVQLLAVELFADGLVVDFSFDQDPDAWERELEGPANLDGLEVLKMLRGRPDLRVEDDLGTEYYESGGGGSGGVQVVHGSRGFAPAVPEGVRRLRVFVDERLVELPL